MPKIITSFLLGAASCALSHTAFAQNHDQLDEIIATGLSVRSGGAQDIRHFRGEVNRGTIPSSKGMTSEGLLAEHNILLTGDAPCAQLLCINSAVAPSSIVKGDYFAGIGFDTNLGDDWDREPLNLVAVIDRSGSMGGDSIENVKRSLNEIADNLREGDQITLILYGSEVVLHMDTTAISKKAKSELRENINSIYVRGSTNMDAALERGYEIAKEMQSAFDGQTRLMIFTDERPNTGRTDAEGFMARAKAASYDGIGLTAIGYGVDYGAELGAKIASVRGGNLFYVNDKKDVQKLFDKEFDYMVSEVAHDLSVNIKPAAGLKVEQVFGVPDYMTTREANGSVTLNVPTLFLSTTSGGLFASLSGQPVNGDAPLYQAELQYELKGTREFQTLSAELKSEPNAILAKAEALSAQYAAIKTASDAYHDNDFEKAFEIFKPFADNFDKTKIKGLKKEKKLVASLHDNFAIKAKRFDAVDKVPVYARIEGDWEVTKAREFTDVHKGDRFEFGEHRVEHFKDEESYQREYYRVNDKQIYLTKSDLTFNARFDKKGHLKLRHPDGKAVIYLKPVTYEAPNIIIDENFVEEF